MEFETVVMAVVGLLVLGVIVFICVDPSVSSGGRRGRGGGGDGGSGCGSDAGSSCGSSCGSGCGGGD